MHGCRTLWLDVSAGVAGDMLLAALLDAGAAPDGVRAAVEAVIPGTVRIEVAPTRRGGLAATAVTIDLLRPDQPHRRWADIRSLLDRAVLPDAVRRPALAVFGALARAEADVHGVGPDDVRFHEVGAWDSIADVVGVCAALASLDVTTVVAGRLALGSGTVSTAHGDLPVPVPAVLRLSRGWPVTSGGPGELATPTGVALVTTLASVAGPLPDLTLQSTGTGAGRRERPDRPNVVRAVLGTAAAPDLRPPMEAMVLVETTVDDLDPRVWPVLVEELLATGAADAWLTPVLMRKGRPGQVLSALTPPRLAPAVRRLVLDRTTTLGVRQTLVEREVLDRCWIDVELPITGGQVSGGQVSGGQASGGQASGGQVAIKIGMRDGRVVHVTPEFADAARLAAGQGRGVREVLEQAAAAAVAAGLTPGAPLPAGARPRASRDGGPR